MRQVTMAVLLAAVAAVAFAHSNQDGPVAHSNQDGPSGHGNNPRWVGVSLGGIDLGMNADVFIIIETLAPDVLGPANDCAALAVQTCGQGRVCWVCYANSEHPACSFACQDSDGDCTPAPPCGNNSLGRGAASE
jgi:hypothetical protein